MGVNAFLFEEDTGGNAGKYPQLLLAVYDLDCF